MFEQVVCVANEQALIYGVKVLEMSTSYLEEFINTSKTFRREGFSKERILYTTRGLLSLTQT